MPAATEKPLPRPRQVTMNGWLILVGSVFVVAMAFQQVATLTSIESQDTAARMVADPPLKDLGLSVDDLLSILRVLALVAGACGAAAAILGLEVLRRSRSARVVLSVLAPFMFVAGLAVAGFAAALVVASVAMLWLQPARDWFDGKEPVSRPAPEPVMSSSSTASSASAASTAITGTPLTSQRPPPPRLPRPGSVVVVCVLTWVLCGVAVVATLTSVLVLVGAPDMVLDQLHEQNPDLADQGITDGVIMTATYVTAAVLVPWCVAAMVFAGAAFRGARWGAIALLVSALVAAALCLLAAIANAAALLPLTGCLVTVSLLLRPEARAWFAPGVSVAP